MNNVVRPEPWWNERRPPEPPDPPSMDLPARVASLEAASQKSAERLVSIERDVAVIKSNYATKEDVTALRGEMSAAIAESKSGLVDRMERDFRLLFGALVAVALGLAGLMAKGFHWL